MYREADWSCYVQSIAHCVLMENGYILWRRLELLCPAYYTLYTSGEWLYTVRQTGVIMSSLLHTVYQWRVAVYCEADWSCYVQSTAHCIPVESGYVLCADWSCYVQFTAHCVPMEIGYILWGRLKLLCPAYCTLYTSGAWLSTVRQTEVVMSSLLHTVYQWKLAIYCEVDWSCYVQSTAHCIPMETGYILWGRLKLLCPAYCTLYTSGEWICTVRQTEVVMSSLLHTEYQWRVAIYCEADWSCYVQSTAHCIPVESGYVLWGRLKLLCPVYCTLYTSGEWLSTVRQTEVVMSSLLHTLYQWRLAIYCEVDWSCYVQPTAHCIPVENDYVLWGRPKLWCPVYCTLCTIYRLLQHVSANNSIVREYAQRSA